VPAPGHLTPQDMGARDPWLNYATVKCALQRCRGLIGYANVREPTRLMKLYCSMGCAAEAAGTSLIRVKEP